MSKWNKVADLNKNINKIRNWYRNELQTSKNILSKETSSALVIGLVDVASFRIGNQKSATSEDPSFGVSMLKHSHITDISPSKVEFVYRSKKGARESVPTMQKKVITNPLLVKNLKKMKEATEGNFNCGEDKDDKNLFCMVDKDGNYRTLNNSDVSSYLKKFTKASLHNFRHLNGSKIFVNSMKNGESYRQGITKVARELGHTRMVAGEKVFDVGKTAEDNYIHPNYIQQYGQGHFGRTHVYNEIGAGREDIIGDLKTSDDPKKWRRFLTQEKTPIVRVKDVWG